MVEVTKANVNKVILGNIAKYFNINDNNPVLNRAKFYYVNEYDDGMYTSHYDVTICGDENVNLFEVIRKGKVKYSKSKDEDCVYVLVMTYTYNGEVAIVEYGVNTQFLLYLHVSEFGRSVVNDVALSTVDDVYLYTLDYRKNNDSEGMHVVHFSEMYELYGKLYCFNVGHESLVAISFNSNRYKIVKDV